MGLYINPNYDKHIYKNDNGLPDPNQHFFIKNHTAEMIEEQKKINNSLNHSFHELRKRYDEQELKQSNKWNEFREQLRDLKDMNVKQETLETQVIKKLERLEEGNRRLQEMVSKNHSFEQELLEEMNQLAVSQKGMEKQIDVYGEIKEELQLNIQQQTEFQYQISEQMKAQEQSQEGMMRRLENQEALTQKITRQLEHFRSILYERTSHLSDKIDDVSAYVMKLVSKDPLQTTILMKENTHK
ncbi:hypothetical protein [Oceanobacillus halophilus]|uniref:Uncharacterized protein n=1 Tax=Oceanobacillus halophilus TaxID=930130 RepID=A0A495A5J7_9BACI|nr:hypothetical protein [Oceanobacillus halophilus]RKQ33559.1 hypothetical protein D8M06_10150 [Oceanobacillus halophilus]